MSAAVRTKTRRLSLPPLAVGVLVIAGLGGVLPRYSRIPSYLFPAPSQIATTFVADAPVLMRALWVTLKRHADRARRWRS